MVIVDTSGWIDYLISRNTPQALFLDDLLARDAAATGDLVVCEVLQGIKQQTTFERVRLEFETVTIVPMVTYTLAVCAAENYRLLRRRGVTVRGTVDCLIATTVIEGNHSLLHSDRDFDPFETHLGLDVIHP